MSYILRAPGGGFDQKVVTSPLIITDFNTDDWIAQADPAKGTLSFDGSGRPTFTSVGPSNTAAGVILSAQLTWVYRLYMPNGTGQIVFQTSWDNYSGPSPVANDAGGFGQAWHRDAQNGVLFTYGPGTGTANQTFTTAWRSTAFESDVGVNAAWNGINQSANLGLAVTSFQLRTTMQVNLVIWAEEKWISRPMEYTINGGPLTDLALTQSYSVGLNPMFGIKVTLGLFQRATNLQAAYTARLTEFRVITGQASI
jgi:hypothetical protein